MHTFAIERGAIVTKKRLNRLNQIIDCVVSAGGGGATRKHVATCLGLKVGPHINSMLDECVREGYLTAALDDNEYPPVWKYSPTEKAIA